MAMRTLSHVDPVLTWHVITVVRPRRGTHQISLKCSAVQTRAQTSKAEKAKQNNEDLSELSQAQCNDPDLKHVIKWVKEETQPNWKDISHLSVTCKHYWVRFNSLTYIDDTLYHVQDGVNPKYQIVIPKSFVGTLLKELHNSVTGGHLGIKKTLSKTKDRFYWHKMREDVKYWCTTCDVYASRKPPGKRLRAPIQKYLVGAPLERIAIDIMGPLPTTNKKNSYILVIADYFTKWVDAIPINNQKATTVAQKLVDHFITTFGVPMQLHSDQGRTFESQVFGEVCKILGIEKARTTPYRPQSDGMVERANRTIESMLASFVSQNQTDWDIHLPILMMAYRSSEHESTGTSPCEMMFGRHISLPVDLVLGRLEPGNKCQDQSEYAYKLSNKMDKIHEFARNKLQMSADKMLREYNSKINMHVYEEEDAVWLHIP